MKGKLQDPFEPRTGDSVQKAVSTMFQVQTSKGGVDCVFVDNVSGSLQTPVDRILLCAFSILH